MRRRDTLKRIVRRLSGAHKALKRAGKGARAFALKRQADVVRQLMVR